MFAISPKQKLFTKIIFVLVAVALGVIYLSSYPSNDREWAIDQQILPHAVFKGNSVAVFNIRNFSYTTKDNYLPNYYNKIFDTNTITSVDYIVEPFGSIGAAHTFLSFGFLNGDYVAISVEIRKEVGETFSPIKGLFRRYELMYVIADERDVINLRANYRKNTVYLYPVETSSENMKKLFIDMLGRANDLKEKPEFYNTLINTCTTNIASHINNISSKSVPWDIRLLFPKHSDVMAYELGFIKNDVPLQSLRELHKINDLVETYKDEPDFSRLIRKIK